MKRTTPPRGSGSKSKPGNGRSRSGNGGDVEVGSDTTGGKQIPVRTVSPSGKGSEVQTDRIVSPDTSRGNPKGEDLGLFREAPEGKTLTSNQGLPIQNDADTLKAGPRGPSLLEDFHFREKITHFDHERIP